MVIEKDQSRLGFWLAVVASTALWGILALACSL